MAARGNGGMRMFCMYVLLQMGLLNRMFNRVKTILQGVILTKGKCIN